MSKWLKDKLSPEHYAKTLRHSLGLHEDAPIDVVDVCDRIDVVYAEDDLGRPGGYDGLLIREDGTQGIIVNKNLTSSGRKRFTACHEVGHAKLPEHTESRYLCTAQDMVNFRSGREIEAEANRFAAEFLIPSNYVIKRLRLMTPSWDLIRGIAEQFQTSITATGVQVIKYTSDSCALVLSAGGSIKWVTPSAHMRERFAVRLGQLSEYTYAVDISRGLVVPDRPQLVRADGWLSGVGPDAELAEHSLGLGEPGMVLTLLTLPEPRDDGSVDEELEGDSI